MSPLQSGSDLGLIESLCLPITESSQTGEARRLTATMARQLGFDAVAAERAALVATEAATNLIKHASGGCLIVQPLDDGADKGIEILALDNGPGMADPDRCIADGYSTSGTLGGGLGAMHRLTQSFEIQTAPQQGTSLLMRLWSQPSRPHPAPPFAVGAIHVPVPPETVCGDGWAIEEANESVTILVVDGLGHGPLAAEASKEAIRLFRQHAAMDLVELMRTLHSGLRPTRGAAAAMARIDSAKREIQFVGVGNIAATIVADGTSRSMVSFNGTIGHEARKIQSFAYEFPADALLVMHSDGLSSHWRIDQFAGLSARDPAIIAGVLFRDFRRLRDDATVVVLRQNPGDAA